MGGAKRWSRGRFLLRVGRIGLAVIFLWAAYAKLRPQNALPWSLDSFHVTASSLRLSMAFFAMQVDSYQLLPTWAVSPFAHALPWIELALGVLLLCGFVLRYVSLAATFLLVLLYAVVIRTYALHLSINCGCFGPNEKLGPWTLLRDGSMLAFGVAVTVGAFRMHRRNRPARASGDQSPGVSEP